MSDALPVDSLALREEVKAKYRARRGRSARQLSLPHRTAARGRLGYDESIVEAFAVSATRSRSGR
jgi:hypothetical protein